VRTATSRNTPKSASTCADWLTNMHEYIEHQQNNVGDRPGYAAEERGQLPADITHETELIQLAAQREKHREPEESDQGTALEIDVLERQNVGCEEHTEASEGHRRKAQAQGVRHHPPVTMTAKVTATIHSSRVSRPMLLSSLRAIAGASGVSVTPGGNSREISLAAEEWSPAPDRCGKQPLAEGDLHTGLRRQRHADGIGGGGSEP
jgi:hypothetical protein